MGRKGGREGPKRRGQKRGKGWEVEGSGSTAWPAL